MSKSTFNIDDFFNLDLFVKINDDYEKRQYRVLESLKRIRKKFRSNYIYPELEKLVSLYRNLKELSKRIKEMEEQLPKRIKKFDLENKQIIKEPIYVDPANLAQVERIIDWGIPLVKETLDEGVAVFEYVDENTKIERVGIMPKYREEGYVFVPSLQEEQLKLYQFEISFFHSSDDKYRTLKTSLVDTVEWGELVQSPNSNKLDLIRKNQEMPNPATYSIATQVECPFNETLFPVAKRKLMRHLSN
jgi:hypothetical protein